MNVTEKKKQALQAGEDAMGYSVEANDANTHESHSKAASMHRIAAEHHALAGDEDGRKKHADMAVEHDLCAGRCKAADQGTNVVKLPDGAAKVAARKGEQDDPEQEDAMVRCAKCKHEFCAAEQEGHEAGTVKCPGCGEPVKVSSQSIPTEEQRAKAAEVYGVHMASQLSARAAADVKLMASVGGAGYSFSDMQSQLAELVRGLDVSKPTDGNQCCSSWPVDIVAPDEEEDETWECVFTAPDGKLYCVGFKVGDELELVGDPKEVERTTDYEYVGDMEARAKQAADALMAEGSSEGARKGWETRKGAYFHASEADRHADAAKDYALAGEPKEASKSARQATQHAEEASEIAHTTGEESDHRAASLAHNSASSAHKSAAAGGSAKSQGHETWAEMHQKIADQHHDKAFNAKTGQTQDQDKVALEAEWSDAAREAAALARKTGMHSTQYRANAESLGTKASDASLKAVTEHTAEAHQAAAAANHSAASAHMLARDTYAKGSKEYETHDNAIKFHEDRAASHEKSVKQLGLKKNMSAKSGIVSQVKSCHAELVASGVNPTLRQVASAVFAKHRVSLGEEDVARALMASGSSEGAKKGWETRKFGEPTDEQHMNQVSGTMLASEASDKANRATEDAHMSDDEHQHMGATEAHRDAQEAHEEAMSHYPKGSSLYNFHKLSADMHGKMADHHSHTAEMTQARSAGGVNGALMADGTSEGAAKGWETRRQGMPAKPSDVNRMTLSSGYQKKAYAADRRSENAAYEEANPPENMEGRPVTLSEYHKLAMGEHEDAAALARPGVMKDYHEKAAQFHKEQADYHKSQMSPEDAKKSDDYGKYSFVSPNNQHLDHAVSDKPFEMSRAAKSSGKSADHYAAADAHAKAASEYKKREDEVVKDHGHDNQQFKDVNHVRSGHEAMVMHHQYVGNKLARAERTIRKYTASGSKGEKPDVVTARQAEEEFEALMASNPEGYNQYTKGMDFKTGAKSYSGDFKGSKWHSYSAEMNSSEAKDHAEKGEHKQASYAAASSASEADKASRIANMTGKAADHRYAASASQSASEAHGHAKEGNEDFHDLMSQHFAQLAKYHGAQAAAKKN